MADNEFTIELKGNRKIADVTVEDIPQIAELEQICFSDPWSEELLRDSLENGLYRFIAVKSGDRVLGYAGMFMTIPEAQIANIAVAPEARRQGIGRLLVQGLADVARKAGAETAFLEVREHNYGAIALYEQEGFVRLGMRKNYYDDPVENGFIYAKQLGDHFPENG